MQTVDWRLIVFACFDKLIRVVLIVLQVDTHIPIANDIIHFNPILIEFLNTNSAVIFVVIQVLRSLPVQSNLSEIARLMNKLCFWFGILSFSSLSLLLGASCF
jgi:hypothetical protein